MEFSTTSHWDTLPNRDQVLEKVYDFFDYLSKKQIQKADALIYGEDIDNIQKKLHQKLNAFVQMELEDEEVKALGDNLALEVSNPYEIDEVLMNPEFSGKSFVTEPGETLSLRIALRGSITNVVAQFSIVPHDGQFHLQLDRFFQT